MNFVQKRRRLMLSPRSRGERSTNQTVIALNIGRIPEAPAYGGGILVPPDDEDPLATVLRQLLGDASHGERPGSGALKASRDHFLWEGMRHHHDSVICGLAS
jgi:hypothetical protein